MAKKEPEFHVACPEGHTDELRVRFVSDAPLRPVDLGAFRCLEPVLTPAKRVEVVDVDGQPGVDSGVWCPTCEEWYRERECIQRGTRRTVRGQSSDGSPNEPR